MPVMMKKRSSNTELTFATTSVTALRYWAPLTGAIGDDARSEEVVALVKSACGPYGLVVGHAMRSWRDL